MTATNQCLEIALCGWVVALGGRSGCEASLRDRRVHGQRLDPSPEVPHELRRGRTPLATTVPQRRTRLGGIRAESRVRRREGRREIGEPEGQRGPALLDAVEKHRAARRRQQQAQSGRAPVTSRGSRPRADPPWGSRRTGSRPANSQARCSATARRAQSRADHPDTAGKTAWALPSSNAAETGSDARHWTSRRRPRPQTLQRGLDEQRTMAQRRHPTGAGAGSRRHRARRDRLDQRGLG